MNHIARSTFIVAFFFGIDKVLGLLRQLVITRQFALSQQMDVFNASNNIPDMLSALISGGALGVALIPVLTEYLENQGRPQAWKLFSYILNLAFIFTAVISFVTAILSPWLVDYVVAPNFTPEQKKLTVELMRLDLIAILVFSISGLLMAGLQANKHFLLPALAPGLYNIGQIFGAVFLAPVTFKIGIITLPSMGLGIHGLVYGVIIGALLHFAIQVPGLVHFKFVWKPTISIHDPGVIKVISLLTPRLVTMFFIQMFFIVRDNYASGLGEGSITALTLGWFIMQVPETLLGTAIGIALLPTLSELYITGNREAFKNKINAAIKILLALTIPITAILFVGLSPLIQAVFKLSPTDSQKVFLTTCAFLVGLTGHTLLEIASRSFYAQQNAKTPLYAAALNSISFIILAWFFSKAFQQPGIALASSIVFTVQACVLLWLLNRSYPGLLDVRNTLARSCLVTLIVSILFFFLSQILPFNPLYLSLGGIVLSMGIILLFIKPEIKLLLKGI
jgi:putative peptidoglycan lipid II flippase